MNHVFLNMNYIIKGPSQLLVARRLLLPETLGNYESYTTRLKRITEVYKQLHLLIA